jgi:PAS domain S-box-containing protein
MDQDQTYERKLTAGIDRELPSPDEGASNDWVAWLTMVSLKVIVAVSIFQWLKDTLLARTSSTSSNIYLVILGSTLATICAYLILLKYQTLIQQMSRDKVQLGERLGARTFALEKANEEMRLEIAERGRVEKDLMASESRFRTIIREAALGIALIDNQGRVIEGNPALLAMLGYAPEELRGMEFSRINHPENAQSSWENFQELLSGKLDVCRMETRYIRKEGYSAWGRQSITLVRGAEGQPQFAVALFEDITERKESEEKIRTYQHQLQSLASELSLTEERERRRLAMALHDHIAQLLMLAKGKFDQIQESKIYRTLAKPMEEIRRLIEESIRYTRSLVFELSPPILHDLGLEPAIQWLAEYMQQQHGLVVAVQDDDHPKSLDNEARMLLFRAVRELLFNVLKHAQTSWARVILQGDGTQVRVIVEDNGVGFAPDKLGALSGKLENYGIFSIRERLNYFGGGMEIESTPGQGARVILTMPLSVNKKKVGSPKRPLMTLNSGSPPEVAKGSARPLAKTRSHKIGNRSALTGEEIPA